MYHSAVELPFDAARRPAGATRVLCQRAFLAASVMWAAALPLAPLAASRPARGDVLFAFAYGAYTLGSLICHQIAIRSFHLGSLPLPVCARCTGIYLGAAAMSVAGVWLRPLARGTEDARMRRLRRVLLLALLPTAATVAYEWTTGVTPPNMLRFAAGAPIGAAVAWIIREVN